MDANEGGFASEFWWCSGGEEIDKKRSCGFPTTGKNEREEFKPRIAQIGADEKKVLNH